MQNAADSAKQGIEAVRDLAEQYREVLCRARLGIRNPGFEWYPYDTLSSLTHCNQLLRGAHRAILGPDGGGARFSTWAARMANWGSFSNRSATR